MGISKSWAEHFLSMVLLEQSYCFTRMGNGGGRKASCPVPAFQAVRTWQSLLEAGLAGVTFRIPNGMMVYGQSMNRA